MSVADLRSELGTSPDPEFDLTLPSGWARRPVDDQSLQIMLGALRTRLMAEHQMQAYAELKVLVERSFKAMRSEGAFAFFTAAEDDPATVWIPASIIASVRRAEPGQTLDSLASNLIQNEGATPLRQDMRTLRLEREKTVRLGAGTVVNHSIVYLTPIPGSARRRAVQLVAGFGRTIETPPDDPAVTAIKYLFDTCVSTLRWRRPD